MDDKRVQILMSTYNGEKFIDEQLKSIFNQTYKNIEILIRDDGSTDSTLDILKKYEQQGKLRLVSGANIGVWRSVCWLAENANESADYYSFADQDDVWMYDKTEKAVNALNKTEHDKPALYFCNYDYYDEEMNFISHKEPLKIELTFINAMVNFAAYGFACVINNEMRRLFLKMPHDSLFPHDYLLLMLGTSLGKVVYDSDYICAKYRRHNKNVSITNESFLKLQLWRIRNFLFSDGFGYIDKWKLYYDIYAMDLSITDREVLSWFAVDKYRCKNAMKKAFYPKRYRDSLYDELALRTMFIVGRV